MRRLILFLFLAPSLFANALPKELQWVQEQINDIKKVRKGAPAQLLAAIEDPFIFLEKNKSKDKKKKEETSLTQTVATKPEQTTKTTATATTLHRKKIKPLELQAIMNKAALIGGKWYRVGQQVQGYTIVRVTLKNVYLKRGRYKKILTIQHRKKK